MKAFLLSLFVFATVFALSSALSHDKEKDHKKGFVSSEKENAKPLQKRKPPGKVPGPKLTHELNSEALTGINDEKIDIKRLSDRDRKKKDVGLKSENNDFISLDRDSRRDEKNKNKDRNLVNGARYIMNRKEDTQEEKATEMRYTET